MNVEQLGKWARRLGYLGDKRQLRRIRRQRPRRLECPGCLLTFANEQLLRRHLERLASKYDAVDVEAGVRMAKARL